MAGASKITDTLLTLAVFSIQTNSRGTCITYYHSYTKSLKCFTDQIQDGRTPASLLEKVGFRYSATKIHLGRSE